VIELRSPVLGEMNARNLLGVIALARALGVSQRDVQDAAATFHGVRRRQEVVHDGRVTLIDDFAHHPTAIAATLAAVRSRYPGRRVWALFDPRSNTTRRRIFQEDIAHALSAADEILIGPVHRALQLPPDERFSPEEAAATIARLGRSAAPGVDVDAMVARVVADIRPGDVVVALSNGGFGGLVARLAAGLS
jgi:UDP-N-acetylmuramate: L-alanyl-gamma-D-glutamyl-meso-diaminopimelate ligase